MTYGGHGSSGMVNPPVHWAEHEPGERTTHAPTRHTLPTSQPVSLARLVEHVTPTLQTSQWASAQTLPVHPGLPHSQKPVMQSVGWLHAWPRAVMQTPPDAQMLGVVQPLGSTVEALMAPWQTPELLTYLQAPQLELGAQRRGAVH